MTGNPGPLRLYLLNRTAASRISYEEAAGFVIAAHSPQDARQVLTENEASLLGTQLGMPLPTAFEGDHMPGAEGAATWLDPAAATCRPIGIAAPEVKRGVLLRDYRQG